MSFTHASIYIATVWSSLSCMQSLHARIHGHATPVKSYAAIYILGTHDKILQVACVADIQSDSGQLILQLSQLPLLPKPRYITTFYETHWFVGLLLIIIVNI